jgi:tetratricopeptide (TPR) repeat protein
MKRICIFLMAMVIPSLFFVEAQEKITVTQFDQYYELLPTGNVNVTWEITIVPEEGIKDMLLHAFFSKKAYVKDVVVTDAEGSLNSKMLSGEGVPILEINFRNRLTPGAEYHFTCNLEVWKAIEVGETEGSFTLLTGYNFPVENLEITAVLPEGTRLRNYFPADGRVSSGQDVSIIWRMSSLPREYNIQVSISFDILSESFADNLFSDGVNLYNLKDFENARQKFEQALEIYQSLNLQEKADQCSAYFDRIEGLETGLPVVEEGISFYDSGEYGEALQKFEEAKSIYEEHGLSTDDIEKYIADSTAYVEAFSELQKAEAAIQQGNEEEALNHFSNAKQLFLQVGDTSRVQQVDSKLQEITLPVKSEEPEKERNVVPLVVVVVVVIVAVIGIAASKMRKPPPVYTKEEIQEEMRQLKARYVYGEINRKDYEERLAELEKMSKKPE